LTYSVKPGADVFRGVSIVSIIRIRAMGRVSVRGRWSKQQGRKRTDAMVASAELIEEEWQRAKGPAVEEVGREEGVEQVCVNLPIVQVGLGDGRSGHP
jgi:hypothetical protein